MIINLKNTFLYHISGSKTTSYQYDLLGRLTKEATGSDSISYEYDKYNNRISMIVTQNAVDKTTNYHYNKNDELLSETTTEDGERMLFLVKQM